MNRLFVFWFAFHASLLSFTLAPSTSWGEPLKVSATVPELGDLIRQIGGDEVTVSVFAKPGEDPHFVQAKPSFIRELSEADLFALVGLELEVGWAPALVEGARNPKIHRGSDGYLDASLAIRPLEIPSGAVDRSLGDVHPFGNPHYLLDPIQGLRVSRLIRERLSLLRPQSASHFAERYRDFANRISVKLVGTELAAKYDIEKLAELNELGQLEKFLSSQGDLNSLGGWLSATASVTPANVIADHNLWPYFAKRFGVTLVGFLEPKPGIAPSAAHLEDILADIKTKSVKALLSSAYYDPKHAHFISEHADIPVALMAHQLGSRPGTDDYLSFIDANVNALVRALQASGE